MCNCYVPPRLTENQRPTFSAGNSQGDHQMPWGKFVQALGLQAALIGASLLFSTLCACAQPCPTLATPWTVAYQALLSMPILQARILEWVAISYSRGSFWPREQTCASCIAGRFLTGIPYWATGEAPSYSLIFSFSLQDLFTISMIRKVAFVNVLPAQHSPLMESSWRQRLYPMLRTLLGSE